jgi:hypothetical protein
MRVSGTQVATNTYNIPSGSHWIQFMYQKDSEDYYSSGSDSITVEIITSSFTGADTGTTLKISNQSFTELTDVIWQNESFANSQSENSIKIGTNVSKSITAGGGYIYFKRKSNAITARTKDMVTVNEGETIDFTFTDNTLIVEANNPDNAGTLSALQSTVVWWDDAEGEMQPYYEAASFVGYYVTQSDLGISSSYCYFNTPKNGNKSIAVGGTNTAKLHLRVSLNKAAKFSFWYANKYNRYSGDETTFSINGTVQRTWSTDVNWSKLEFDLSAGVNDLVWEKDGYYHSSNSSYFYYYLTLDDILIYYTE